MQTTNEWFRLCGCCRVVRRTARPPLVQRVGVVAATLRAMAAGLNAFGRLAPQVGTHDFIAVRRASVRDDYELEVPVISALCSDARMIAIPTHAHLQELPLKASAVVFVSIPPHLLADPDACVESDARLVRTFVVPRDHAIDLLCSASAYSSVADARLPGVNSPHVAVTTSAKGIAKYLDGWHLLRPPNEA
jgi:hypothetical protein